MLEKEFSKLSFYTGFQLILCILLPFLFGYLYLLFNSSGIIFHKVYEISFLICLTFYLLYLKLDNRRLVLKASAISVVLILASLALNFGVYDLSFDGQGYHQDAVLSISNGWNYVHDFDSNSFHDRWINHYPKAAWLSQSYYYNLFGNMSLAKFGNLLLIFGTFLLSVSIFSKFLSNKWELIFFSILFSFDPINLNTFFSFTIDGQLASVIKILILFLLHFELSKSRLSLVALALIIIYAINLKFNAAAFVVFVFVAYLLFKLFTKNFNWKNKLWPFAIATGVLATAVIGFNPYAHNVIKFDHLFYPNFTANQEDEMGADYLPSNFQGQSNLTKFSKSLFAKTSFSKSFNKHADLKIPFSFNIQELQTYAGTGVMLGGMGPLFSGIYILSFIGLLVLMKKSSVVYKRIIIYGVVFLFATILINPMSWWFRFVPQLWLFPCLILIFCCLLNDKSTSLLKNLLFVAMISNLMLMGGYGLFQVLETKNMKAELLKLKKDKEKICTFYFGQHGLSFKEKLNNYGIKYLEQTSLEELKCDLKEFKMTEVKLCMPLNQKE